VTGTIYVVGEFKERGPVKIGITSTNGSGTGRPGLSGGNWRQLHKLATLEEDLSLLRWSEWRIHRCLEPWHRGGEWYAVRPLLAEWGTWRRLLLAARAGRVERGGDPRVGVRGHRLLAIERMAFPPAPIRFRAQCSCGHVLAGRDRQAFSTVLRRFCEEHLGTNAPSSLKRVKRRAQA
jgi:hypothetical protein